jgi:hypothetical protein
MAINTKPVFTDIPLIGGVKFVNGTDTAAGTDRTGATGTIKTLVTGTTYGIRVDRVTAISSNTGAAAAKVIYLWLYDGTNYYLHVDLEMPAVTSSTSVAGATATVIFDRGLIVPTGWFLKCAPSILGATTDNCHVVAIGGDYNTAS